MQVRLVIAIPYNLGVDNLQVVLVRVLQHLGIGRAEARIRMDKLF
jgi:hypothetical protein